LRTPLTTISDKAGNLLHNSHSFDEETKQQIYAYIYDNSMYLTNLIENLLYSIHIEEGRMVLKISAGSKLIVQIIINLVDNALKYTPADAYICISANSKN